jgi:hypothetical protein
MPAYFLDSSALVKRYTIEVGTARVISLFKPAAANRSGHYLIQSQREQVMPGAV